MCRRFSLYPKANPSCSAAFCSHKFSLSYLPSSQFKSFLSCSLYPRPVFLGSPVTSHVHGPPFSRVMSPGSSLIRFPNPPSFQLSYFPGPCASVSPFISSQTLLQQGPLSSHPDPISLNVALPRPCFDSGEPERLIARQTPGSELCVSVFMCLCICGEWKKRS